MRQKFSLSIVIALMLMASALTLAGMLVIMGMPLRTVGTRADFAREYAQLLSAIEENFIGDFDEQAAVTASMRAAVAALDDHWSFFMTAEELAQNMDNVHNRHDGIGVNVFLDNQTGYITVVDVVRGSAAEYSGILPGDILLSVDGNDLVGESILTLREFLSRPHGETAEILLRREDGLTETISVVFGSVFIAPIVYDMLDDDIGYIRLFNFKTGSADSFISAANDLIEAGATGFVFDMRANPGGLVTEMSDILDFLLPEGEIFILVDRNGNENITMSDPEYIDLPMVVIVDASSFSAAEYFAATLREFGFAEIVGEQTTGKSRVQRIVRLQNGAAINISFAEYLTRNRVSLHDEGGVTPDHSVALSEEDMRLFRQGNLDLADDPQLRAALGLMTSQAISNQARN